MGQLQYQDGGKESHWEIYGGRTFTGPVGVNKNNPVTHWMPLPARPGLYNPPNYRDESTNEIPPKPNPNPGC